MMQDHQYRDNAAHAEPVYATAFINVKLYCLERGVQECEQPAHGHYTATPQPEVKPMRL